MIVEDELIENLKIDTVVGKALKIDDRTLYPIIRISILKKEERNFFGTWISPLAMVVVEPAEEYVIPLTDEDIDHEQLLQMVLMEKMK